MKTVFTEHGWADYVHWSETDRRSVLVEMTEVGQARTWEAYGPLVEAGQPMLAELSPEQLELMRDVLVRMRELTDEYRDRLVEP